MTNLVNIANKPKAVIPPKPQKAVKIVAVSTPEPAGGNFGGWESPVDSS